MSNSDEVDDTTVSSSCLAGVLQKALATVLYLAAAVALVNWADLVLWEPSQVSPNPTPWLLNVITYMAVSGGVIFAVAAVLVPFWTRYAVILGAAASCLVLPLCGLEVLFLPWGDIELLIHSGAVDTLAATFFPLFAVFYTLVEVWTWLRGCGAP